MIWIAILALGLVAGTLSGIVGFGASIMLMPVLMLAFGPQEAVPIMAIARCWPTSRAWWCGGARSTGAPTPTTASPRYPAAALGARTLLILDPRIVEGILGALFIVMVPTRRWLFARGMRIKAWHLALVGAGIGFLSGLVASTGPINTPFFLAYGLVKGAYLSTEALGSMAIGITKAIVFQRFDALPLETVGARAADRRLADGGLPARQGLRAAARRQPVPPADGRAARRRRARAAGGCAHDVAGLEDRDRSNQPAYALDHDSLRGFRAATGTKQGLPRYNERIVSAFGT